MTDRARLRATFIDALFVLAGGALVANTLGIALLNSPNWPTGGDSASHLLYAWLYADSLLLSGHILPWVPEVFGGLPFLSYYFPLPFIVIALLSKLIGFAQAFKWGAFFASMLLPGAVEMAERSFGLPVRLGVPARVGGLVDIIGNPTYATGVGLVLYGMKRRERGAYRMRDDKILSKVKHRMSDWLSDFF